MTPELKALVEKKAHEYVCTRFPNALEVTHAETFRAGAELLASVLGEYERALEFFAGEDSMYWDHSTAPPKLCYKMGYGPNRAREALAAGRRILEGKVP